MEQQSTADNQKYLRLSSWKQLIVVTAILLSGGVLPVVTSGQVAYASSYTSRAPLHCQDSSSCNYQKKRYKRQSTRQQQQNQSNRALQANTTGSNAATTGSTGNTFGAYAPTAGGQGGTKTFGANAPTVGGAADSRTFGAFTPTISGTGNKVKQSNQINSFICLGSYKSNSRPHAKLSNFKDDKTRKSVQQQKQQQDNITFTCM